MSIYLNFLKKLRWSLNGLGWPLNPRWLVFIRKGKFGHRGSDMKRTRCRTSLVAQWLRIRLPVQGTWVRSLVQEDPTCRGATKPVRHNYWARVPQLLKPTRLEPCSATREATAMRSPRTTKKSSPRSPQLEKARVQQWRLNAAKNK